MVTIMNNDNSLNGAFRRRTVPFTQVSNSALEDKTLSLKAKGLYSIIQRYITIPNFILYKGHLMSICTEREMRWCGIICAAQEIVDAYSKVICEFG